MRVTDLQRCEVRPGRLVEWALHPAAVAAASALPDDERPPAYVQESHLRTSLSIRRDGLFMPTWLGTAFDLPGRVDLDVLEVALRTWALRHETLRSGFRWAGDEVRRFTLAPEAVGPLTGVHRPLRRPAAELPTSIPTRRVRHGMANTWAAA